MNILAGAIHMHSDYSHDGLDSLEMLREACIARKIRWVGMTDHAEDISPEVYGEYKKHCAALSDEEVRFIPGLEFRFAGLRGVHLFALDLAEWMRPATPADFFDHADRHARLTVLAHPVLCRYVVPVLCRPMCRYTVAGAVLTPAPYRATAPPPPPGCVPSGWSRQRRGTGPSWPRRWRRTWCRVVPSSSGWQPAPTGCSPASIGCAGRSS